MNIETFEALWPDADCALAFDEFAERAGLAQDLLRQLVEYDVLLPLDATAMTFARSSLGAAQTACRLHRDFELDAAALALVMRLLDRIRHLESAMGALEARQSQYRF
jgi:hypothetical protein